MHLKQTKHLGIFCRILAVLGCWIGWAPAAETARPKILLIVSDDQGFRDLPFYGNPDFHTTF